MGVDAPEGVFVDVRHRFPHDIELPGVLDPVDLVPGSMGIVPFGTQFDLR